MALIAGLINLTINGETILVQTPGLTYNLGRPKRDPIIGADGVHGPKETAQVAYIDGPLTVLGDTDVDSLVTQIGATVTLALGNGATVTLQDSWFAGEGVGETEDSKFAARWEAAVGEYLPA